MGARHFPSHGREGIGMGMGMGTWKRYQGLVVWVALFRCVSCFHCAQSSVTIQGSSCVGMVGTGLVPVFPCLVV